ncbi:MAG: DUF2974 domain-containing protein [Desulfobulbaceae bacterium]|nr:DUF2974 domain-containing protein [Desulfobulbaceae bacterium]
MRPVKRLCRLLGIIAAQSFMVFLILKNPLCAKQLQTDSSAVTLQLSFADAAWDGKTIPKGQQCLEYGGNGASPPILVNNIPPQANKLVLEFSDATYKPCDKGGHGIIGYAIPSGSKKITVPAIPGQSFDLPEGFNLIKEHCGADLLMQPGAYIGPCPGLGNLYYVTIKALYESPDKSTSQLLGIGRLDIGTYTDDPSYAFPATITINSKYFFFFHNYYVEINGPRGACKYYDLLRSFTDKGYVVVSQLRNQNMDPVHYAEEAAKQIHTILEAGVPSGNITVSGHSKGGVIALNVAALLQQPDINYIILAGCGINLLAKMYPDPLLVNGKFLSMYANSDNIAGSCNPLLPSTQHWFSTRELVLDSPKGHRLFFEPDAIWLTHIEFAQ